MNPLAKLTAVALSLLAAAVLAILAGCSTYDVRISEKREDHPYHGKVYPATREDAAIVRLWGRGWRTGDYVDALASAMFAPLIPFYVADLPFSLAIDTVCLPYDLWRHGNDNNKEPAP